MDYLALENYTDQEILLARSRNVAIIEEHRGLKPPQPTGFWKAVENRVKLDREIRKRGIEPETEPTEFPSDRLPFLGSIKIP